MVAVMMISAAASFAQMGVRMGLNLADLGGEGTEGHKTSAGLHLGFVDNFELGGSISIQPGVYYMQRNSKYDIDILGIQATQKVHMNYLDIPVLIKYNLEVGPVSIDPHVGPYFGFAFAGKIKDTDPSIRIFSKASDKHPGNWNYSNFDMGMQIGCGATYETVYFGLDYQLGFKDIEKNSSQVRHNRCFMVTLGVWFGN